MKEIGGNLKQDMKELLGEGAGLISAFIHKGLCTVRTIAEKWKEHDVDVGVALPPAAKGKKAARLLETSGPVVTILEGSLGEHQQGQRLSLLEANQLVRQQAQQYQLSGEQPPALRVRFDFMAEGHVDSYTGLPQYRNVLASRHSSADSSESLFRDLERNSLLLNAG